MLRSGRSEIYGKGEKRMKRSLMIIVGMILILSLSSAVLAAGIKNTKHDLSAGSTAEIKSVGEDQICIFCHTPHNAIVPVPLWNRSTATGSTEFQLYMNEDTIDGTVSNDLAGTVSYMCLSCHDGTTALNNYGYDPASNPAVSGPGVTDGKLSSPAALGKDLTNDHPINITYAYGQDPGLNNPDTIVCQLFDNTVQCGSCHSVHDNTNEPFLRMSNAGSALCLDCHNK